MFLFNECSKFFFDHLRFSEIILVIDESIMGQQGWQLSFNASLTSRIPTRHDNQNLSSKSILSCDAVGFFCFFAVTFRSEPHADTLGCISCKGVTTFSIAVAALTCKHSRASWSLFVALSHPSHPPALPLTSVVSPSVLLRR